MPFVDVRAMPRGVAGVAQNPVALQSNQYGELLQSQGLPAYTEITRQGKGWNVISAALTPLVAIPTTTAAQEIFNATSGVGAVTLVVDTLFAFQLLSTAATQTYAIWAMVTTQKASITNAALNLYSHSGAPVVATTAAGRIQTAAGTTVVANGWRPWGVVQAWGTATATPGNAWHAEVNGRILIPPGCSLCLHIVGALATASSFQVGASVYEVPGLAVVA